MFQINNAVYLFHLLRADHPLIHFHNLLILLRRYETHNGVILSLFLMSNRSLSYMTILATTANVPTRNMLVDR